MADNMREVEIGGIAGEMAFEASLWLAEHFPQYSRGMIELERIIVVSDSNPEKKYGDRKVLGLVIARRYDVYINGATTCRDGKGKVIRLKLVFTTFMNVHGASQNEKWKISFLKPVAPVDEDDITLNEAAASIS